MGNTNRVIDVLDMLRREAHVFLSFTEVNKLVEEGLTDEEIIIRALKENKKD